jgi:PhzF family phenazine biosynthesis protein
LLAVQRPFMSVDVFTAERYRGNPLAVVLDGRGLTTDEMQRFATWTNLSETAFVVPVTDSSADYRVRIFSTEAEMVFAGHPTLGTCAAWLASGGVARDPRQIIQECGVGLVAVRVDTNGRLAFLAPPLLRSGPLDVDLVDQVLADLRVDSAEVIDSAWVDNGSGWIGVRLADADRVLAVRPATVSAKIGIIGAYPPDAPTAFEVRAFAPRGGRTLEDPVTGSLNAGLAQWAIGSGFVTPPYTVSQGTICGRAGRLHIDTDDEGRIWVGGDVVTCAAGHVDL